MELKCSGGLQLQLQSVPRLPRDLSDQTGLCELLAEPAQLGGEDGQLPQQSDGVCGGTVHGQLGRPRGPGTVRHQHWAGTDKQCGIEELHLWSEMKSEFKCCLHLLSYALRTQLNAPSS